MKHSAMKHSAMKHSAMKHKEFQEESMTFKYPASRPYRCSTVELRGSGG
jgi:hypothetical protein